MKTKSHEEGGRHKQVTSVQMDSGVLSVGLGSEQAEDATRVRRWRPARLSGWDKALALLSDGVLCLVRAPDEHEPHIAYANLAMLRLTGYEAAELIGQPLSLLTEWPADAVPVASEQAPDRVTYRRKSGTWCWVEQSIQALTDAADEPHDEHLLVVVREVNAAATTEQALRESEARFHNLCALSSDWYWEQDANFRFTLFEGQASAQFVHRQSLGKTPWDVPAFNMDEAAWAAHRDVLRAHRPFHGLEVHRARPDGESVWIEISGEPAFNAAGAFVGYRGVGRDITARKASETALRQANQLLNIVLENNRFGFVKVEADGRISYHNSRFAEMLELPASVLAGEAHVEKVAAFQRARGDLASYYAQGEPSQGVDPLRMPLGDQTYERRTRSGKYLSVSTRFLEGGGWVRTYTDLTPHRDAQDALAASEARFRSLSALSSDWYWEQDSEFRFTRFDGRDLAHPLCAQGQGKTLWELPWLHMGAAAWQAHQTELLARRAFRGLELQWAGADALSDWVELSGEPAFNAAGAFVGYRGVGCDITARKASETVWRRANQLLNIILENNRFGFVKVEADGRVSYFNRRFAELLELPLSLLEGELTSQKIHDFQASRGDLALAPPVDRPDAREIYLPQQTPLEDYTYERRTLSGRTISVSTRVLDDGGWVRTYTDLTDYQNAQTALAESEARFRSLTELSSDWYWEQDDQFRYTRMEGQGITDAHLAARLLGKRPWDEPALNMDAAAWQAHRSVLDGHQVFRQLELQRTDGDGRSFWMALSGVPYFDANGVFKGYRGVGRDISDSKRAEQDALDRLAFSQRLTHSVPGLVYQMCMDASGQLSLPFASAGTRETFELEPDAMQHRVSALFDRIVETDREHVRQSMLASAADLSPWEVEYRVALPKAGLRWHHTRSRPERRADGSVVWYGFTSDVTERIHSTQQLREANQLLTGRTDLLEVTLANLSQGVVMFDAQGRAVFHNQRFLQLLSLPESLMRQYPTLDEIVDHQFETGTFPGMDRDAVSARYGRVVGQRHIDGPGQYLRESSDGRTFEVKATPLPSGGWVRTYADVSDYVRAQRQLKQGEERLQLVLQGSNDGAWDWNIATGEVYFSPRWWEMLGWRVQERAPENRLWADFIHPHDVLRVRSEIDEALSGQRSSFELEFRMLHREGHVLTVLDRGFIVRDEHGRAVRLSGTLSDITLRKQLEQRLEQSEASLSAFFESMPDAVWFKDLMGRYVLCNPVKARLYGMTVEQLLGRTEVELVAAELAEAIEKSDRQTLSASAPIVFEDELFFEGEIRVFEVVKRAVHDHRGVSVGVLGMARDITERKRAEAEIERLAFFDPLTHLCNRRLFQDRLEQAQVASVRSDQWAAVCFIDLDNFKDLNDTLGHDTGDELLRQVAGRLKEMVRDEDTVARLGGDEFVVLFEQLGMDPNVAVLNANVLGQKLLKGLNHPYNLFGVTHHKTPSIGLTLFHHQEERIEDILKRADLAMYQSKAAGRNTVRFYDPEMQAVVTARAALERDLREAVADGQFQMYYQPVVGTDRTPVGYEALVRWRHPVRGMVSPAEFIPVAEQTGLILPIGQWVLRSACEQLVRWATNPATAELTLAVNLSARQLRHAEFVTEVLDMLEQTGARADRLKFELTESLLLHDVEETIVKMQELASQGIRFALDDFGTGYSSLSYLKRLPLNQLKIDQSFVRDLLTDPNDAAIARTILQLAQSLDLDVVAEGVETEGQRQFLHIMGCKAFQGYLFGRPAPLE